MSSGIGLVFPGQGSQSVGMGQALCAAFPSLRGVFDEASDVVGYDLATLCFEGPAETLNLTEYTQPALLTSSLAAFRLLEGIEVRPLAVAGHSVGEYSALVAAGGCSFRDAVSLVKRRGQYMAEAVPKGTGLVVAVLGLDPSVIEEACQEARALGVVAPANFNSPGQVVVAGEKPAVERAMEIVKTRGCRKAIPLPVSVPVHTPLMQPAADRLAQDLAVASLTDLRVPLVNNADAKAIQQASEVRASLIRQLPTPVQWIESIQLMSKMGVNTFVEIGPGTVLTGLIKRIVPGVVTLNIHDPKSLDITRDHLRGLSGAAQGNTTDHKVAITS